MFKGNRKECACKWTHVLSAPLHVRYIKTGQGQNYKTCCSIVLTELLNKCWSKDRFVFPVPAFDIFSVLAGCWEMVFMV